MPRRPPLELVPWLLLAAVLFGLSSCALGAFTTSPDWLVLGLDALAAGLLAWAVWRVHGPQPPRD